MRRLLVLFLYLVVGCQGGTGTPPTQPAGRTQDVQKLDTQQLHNAYRVSDRLYSGSGPESDAAFAELANLGVKTIISVDGAKPNVEAARRHGMTYVHLPIGYDGVPPDKVATLAKVAETATGPIYVHCHHGQHRGPAAVAAILLCTDPTWNAVTAEAWLASAGTDPKYKGLVGLPRSLVKPTAAELAALPAAFPSVAPVADLTRMMVDVDARWDHLKAVKKAGWKVPKEHPDIDPPHEAVQLAELYREAARLEDTKKRGPEFVKLMKEAEAAAAEVEQALRAKPTDAGRAEKAFTRSAATCTACHSQFRDLPKP